VVERFGVIANRELALGWQVNALVSIVAAACACLCGTLLTVAARRRSVIDMLRRGATAPPRELIVRRLLVTGEVTLAFILLVSMTMLGRSLLATLDVNPGFDARGVLTMRVSLPIAVYPRDERVASFYSALQSALSERLGPGTIAIVDELPLTGDRGRTLVGTRIDAGREAVVRVASPDYFAVMRIPVVAGRQFGRADDASVQPRVVVSESVAERLFGNESPIGRRVVLSAPATEAEIVGVVGDVRHRSLNELAAPTIYMSAWQAPSRSSHIIVRSARPDGDLIAIVREETAQLDRDLPVYAVRPMEEVVAASPGVPARRVLTAAMTAFAVLALVLGAIGVFGVAAHDVARRRGDLALRLALGAEPRRLLKATLSQGALLVGTGLVAGGTLSIGVARVIDTISIGPSHADPWSIAAAAVVLAVTGFVAVLPAALRAARTDPLIALRDE
jgi:predicted permease